MCINGRQLASVPLTVPGQRCLADAAYNNSKTLKKTKQQQKHASKGPKQQSYGGNAASLEPGMANTQSILTEGWSQLSLAANLHSATLFLSSRGDSNASRKF
mmetsp:Transcript_5379/g.7576  ORF Transcript_5379/g.7576 Transcript_5379/m.7576 type:complete len:102 (-) Transcript_5379:919-1224(-)